MTDIVKLYNPAIANNLTAEQLAGLQKLTSSELKELAEAYPNRTMQKAFLLIIDSTKPPEKQLPTLSTFENLWNLREKNAQRNFVAYSFKGNAKPTVQTGKAKRTEVLDLSEVELMDLPGFAKAKLPEPDDVFKAPVHQNNVEQEKVKIIKIKKTKSKSKK